MAGLVEGGSVEPMSDGIYEPVNDDENDGQVVDLDQVLGEDGVDEALDSAYSPPERPHGLNAFGTTAAEERAGETLDQRLAQEEPDPAMEVDLVEGEPSGRAGEGTPIPDDIDVPSNGDVPDDEFAAEALADVLDDGEVGDARAGRLVDADGGGLFDTEKDLIASDVGIDGAVASAEEAAMHVVDLDEADANLARDEGSTIGTS